MNSGLWREDVPSLRKMRPISNTRSKPPTTIRFRCSSALAGNALFYMHVEKSPQGANVAEARLEPMEAMQRHGLLAQKQHTASMRAAREGHNSASGGRAPVAMRSTKGCCSALWKVTNGRASAPPAVASSTGVSTCRAKM